MLNLPPYNPFCFKMDESVELCAEFNTPLHRLAGGVFMCRYNFLWGGMLLAFGLGVLIGLWLEGGFFCFCFGILMMGMGYLVMKNKH